jgi:hypothetical protein
MKIWHGGSTLHGTGQGTVIASLFFKSPFADSEQTGRIVSFIALLVLSFISNSSETCNQSGIDMFIIDDWFHPDYCITWTRLALILIPYSRISLHIRHGGRAARSEFPSRDGRRWSQRLLRWAAYLFCSTAGMRKGMATCCRVHGYSAGPRDWKYLDSDNAAGFWSVLR